MSGLTHEITKHVLTKLGVANENLHSAYSSIMNNNFMLEKKLCLINDEDEEINNNMWSCKITVEDKDFRLLLADCSSLGEQEYVLIVALDGSPEYACYWSITDPDASYIACMLNGFWVKASVYMQASFLTGMEQIKDLTMPWDFNQKTDDLYEKLVQFVGHYEQDLA